MDKAWWGYKADTYFKLISLLFSLRLKYIKSCYLKNAKLVVSDRNYCYKEACDYTSNRTDQIWGKRAGSLQAGVANTGFQKNDLF